MVKFGFFIVYFLSLSNLVKAETYYQLQGSFRSVPQSGTMEAQYFYNKKLWSQEDSESPWKYGFWRLGSFVGAHGLAGINVEVFPISIWQIQLQKSMTSRFYDSKNVDCSLVECRGTLTRGIFKTSFVLGWQNYFLIPSYMVTDLVLNNTNKNFSVEGENIVADQMGDQLTTWQLLFGLKQKSQRWVAVLRNSQLKQTRDKNSSQYLIWNQDLENKLNYFIGAGTYRSTYLDQSFSLIVGLNWFQGENLSLF